ncbi:hypothetical protein KSC_062520 [Ktedonobacter sp. SOSP1-52]|uniref:hypothetical protein n=1 Tax=Ktedonobacter sp. SOSP1-52 TaxID=2778366 RepID=UPI001916A066|nr:hypothetical protein [Ktedonobacter sp. SOSP1-52]GHO67360.1 hypothetical protein KSC_062520 [Ktedonobacter sp. SOSP1-52]
MTDMALGQEVVRQKLAAFEELRPEFEQCFRFVQEAHGQKRFVSCSVGDIVYYLHARWICDCKGYLLSVPHSHKIYEGRRGLELLREWQTDGNSANVIAFLQRKLDTLPFADLTRQIEQARLRNQEDGLARRLLHGRTILLNRGFNLFIALDRLFSLLHEELRAEVHAACEQYGHLPEQIEQQLALLDTPLYSYVPHQALARLNMTLMNGFGSDVLAQEGNAPGERSWRVLSAKEPLTPPAEHLFPAYQDLTQTGHNNIMRHRFNSPTP